MLLESRVPRYPPKCVPSASSLREWLECLLSLLRELRSLSDASVSILRGRFVGDYEKKKIYSISEL